MRYARRHMATSTSSPAFWRDRSPASKRGTPRDIVRNGRCRGTSLPGRRQPAACYSEPAIVRSTGRGAVKEGPSKWADLRSLKKRRRPLLSDLLRRQTAATVRFASFSPGRVVGRDDHNCLKAILTAGPRSRPTSRIAAYPAHFHSVQVGRENCALAVRRRFHRPVPCGSITPDTALDAGLADTAAARRA